MIDCRKCGQMKDPEAFALAPRMARGRHSWCKECMAAYNREKNASMTPEDVAERNARRRSRYDPAKAKAKRAEHYERIRAMERKSRLGRKYNLSLEEYEAMHQEQDGCCLICGCFETVLHVDHDHETGEVRGLLCGPCNRMLGLATDDPDRLLAAAAYLLGQRLKDSMV